MRPMLDVNPLLASQNPFQAISIHWCTAAQHGPKNYQDIFEYFIIIETFIMITFLHVFVSGIQARTCRIIVVVHFGSSWCTA